MKKTDQWLFAFAAALLLGGQWRSPFGASSEPLFASRAVGNTADANTWYDPRAWTAPDGSVFGITSSLMFLLQRDATFRVHPALAS